MLPIYLVKENYVGAGNLADYTFDFKIHDLTHLQVMVLDENGDLLYDLRGDDTSFISSVEFDSAAGGGTVTLIDDLPEGYEIIIFMANDAPVQTSEFKGKFTFTLESFEQALDYLACAIQRVVWRAGRAIRLSDAYDNDSGDFDMQLPLELTPNASIIIDEDGLGLELGPTRAELAEALANAEAAAESAASADDSEAAALAAQAAAAAAEAASVVAQAAAAASAASAAASAAAAAATAASFDGFLVSGPFTVLQNNNSDLLAELYDSTVYTQIDFFIRCIRGTTVFTRIEFSIMFKNGAWELNDGPVRYSANDHGMTFTVDAVTGQINAAADNNGAGNAILDIKKMAWTA